MQIGVSSYSFSRLVRAGTMTLKDTIAKAKAIGFDAIEFSPIAVPEGASLEAYARELKDEADRVGIPIALYAVDADFLTGSGGDWQAEVERLKNQLKVAQILGVPGMRHDATAGFPPGTQGARGFDDALPTLAKACRAVTEFAAELGIRTMVENHGRFCQDSRRVEKLVNAVDHPNFGALVDMGNFVSVDESPAEAVGRLLPYALHVHAKDFHIKAGTEIFPGDGWRLSRGGHYRRGAIVGHGNVPVAQVIHLLTNAAYNGMVSIEFEGLEDPMTGITLGYANLRRFVRLSADQAAV